MTQTSVQMCRSLAKRDDGSSGSALPRLALRWSDAGSRTRTRISLISRLPSLQYMLHSFFLFSLVSPRLCQLAPSAMPYAAIHVDVSKQRTSSRCCCQTSNINICTFPFLHLPVYQHVDSVTVSPHKITHASAQPLWILHHP